MSSNDGSCCNIWSNSNKKEQSKQLAEHVQQNENKTKIKNSGMDFTSTVTFIINGKEYKVGDEVDAKTSLNDYIRKVANLTGTKVMCNEGGCGICIVTVCAQHPVTNKIEVFSVNSCLVPVHACGGWEIITVEGIGDRRRGYHKIQATLARFNGTQCGYCTPGMVMNMFSLLQKYGQDKLTMAEIENSFGGNLCRCTGYRPILDAFKSMACDATPELKQACVDIEDSYKICKKTGDLCSGKCSSKLKLPIKIPINGYVWYKPSTLDELFNIFESISDSKYKLVFGNTAEGVYRTTDAIKYIDIKHIGDLRKTDTKPNDFKLGGNVTLTEAMQIFNDVSNTTGLKYMKGLAEHIDKIANVPVRNIGTLAGNLSIKHAHHEFPSDIFTIFEAVGATLIIMEKGEKYTKLSLTDYLNFDMNKKIILSISFPNLNDNYKFKSYKITPRAQNAHAYVNAGFLIEMKPKKGISNPRIVYGGINPKFVHAEELEKYLIDKNLFEKTVIDECISKLGNELKPDNLLHDAKPEFRKKLAQALFFKFILSLDDDKIRATYRSGGTDLKRPISSGIQEFDSDAAIKPVNHPIPKIEAIYQCSGEAEFLDDIPETPDELHAAFVLTSRANGNIAKIDAEPALKMPGVVAFYSQKDITKEGGNNFTPPVPGLFTEVEEIFCSGKVQYAGQVIGLIVAKTRQQAILASFKVIVQYSDISTPVLTIDDARKIKERVLEVKGYAPEEKETKVNDVKADHIISGSFEIGRQYHMAMENQSCLILPKEGSYDVYCTTQFMDLVQEVVSNLLDVPASQVKVIVRRLGGAYGSKISRPTLLAGACAIAVKNLNKPIRLVINFSDNIKIMGKRYSLLNEYEVGVDKNGKILHLKSEIFQDCGHSYNESPIHECFNFFRNCYDTSNFTVNGFQLKTDTASNTWCRAPGTTEGIALIEEVMEHIAAKLNLDPVQVRLINMHKEDNPLFAMLEDIKQKSDYDDRCKLVEIFNKEHRWRKRGISLVPMQYRFIVWGNHQVVVAIHRIDGSVSITHGGIEMGQGMNTKVAQVASYKLGVPLNQITIHPSNSIAAANNIVTGGSLGSEAVAYATMVACETLLKRLEPIKETLPADHTWKQLIATAHGNNIELIATYMFTNKDPVKPYNIWGISVAEVEIDLLTGEKQVLRVDILEDVGKSLSQMIDVGQIEGAFVMGMGYWLQEELKFDPTNGKLLTTRTWNYKPPGAKDIPTDFRVYFRKNAPNPVGVLHSKATGEPSLNMSIVTLFAINNAIKAARNDAGVNDYHIIQPPATTEYIFMDSLVNPEHFNPL